MKILNPTLRKEFASPGRCEICHRWCKKREGHYLWHRTPEISIRVNWISVGSSKKAFTCSCHFDIHNGKIPRSVLLSVVAQREKCLPENIVEKVGVDEEMGEACNGPTDNRSGRVVAASPGDRGERAGGNEKRNRRVNRLDYIQYLVSIRYRMSRWHKDWNGKTTPG